MYDVLVVGSGAAGCCAALAASVALSTATPRILILEKSSKLLGGTTKIAGGGWVWFPKNPFLNEIGLRSRSSGEVVKLMKDHIERTGYGVQANAYDERLMRVFADESEGVIRTLIERKWYVCKPVEVRTKDAKKKVRDLLIRRATRDAPEACERIGLNPLDESLVDTLSNFMPSYCCESVYDYVPVANVLQPTGLNGGTSKQLLKAAQSSSHIEVLRGAHVVGVVTDGETRRVTGVKVRFDKGDVRTICASKGVVFASGGFASDAALVSSVFGDGVVRGTCAAPTNTGDFLRIAARDLDIPATQLDRAWVKQVTLPFDRRNGGVFFLNVDSGFMVSGKGTRFMNEKHHYQERANYMRAHLDTHRLVFFVYDERASKLYNGPLRGIGGPIPFRSSSRVVASGNTISELATSLQALLERVDSSRSALSPDFRENLERTLRSFNGYARSGRDQEFGRGEHAGDLGWHLTGRAEDNAYPNQTMFPLSPPYHCVILGLSLLDTKSGPKIDRKCRVLDRNGHPIQGLFGAGNCIRLSFGIIDLTRSHAVKPKQYDHSKGFGKSIFRVRQFNQN
eukprot:g653.t1